MVWLDPHLIAYQFRSLEESDRKKRLLLIANYHAGLFNELIRITRSDPQGLSIIPFELICKYTIFNLSCFLLRNPHIKILDILETFKGPATDILFNSFLCLKPLRVRINQMSRMNHIDLGCSSHLYLAIY